MPMNWKQDLLSWEAEQAAATSRMSHTLRRVTGEGGDGGREDEEMERGRMKRWRERGRKGVKDRGMGR